MYFIYLFRIILDFCGSLHCRIRKLLTCIRTDHSWHRWIIFFSVLILTLNINMIIIFLCYSFLRRLILPIDNLNSSFNSFHFSVNCRFLELRLCLLCFLLFIRCECPFKELMWYFNIIFVFFLSRWRMIQVEQELISSSVKDSNDLAIFHHSHNCTILEYGFDSAIGKCCELSKIFHVHFFYYVIWGGRHQTSFREVVGFTLVGAVFWWFRLLGAIDFFIVWLLKNQKCWCQKFLRIITDLLSWFLITDQRMNNKRNSITSEVP